uniref:Uncharacterized protein n=1 Tax=Arundo donax TaxID=35708 RepID=A0A0A9EFX2_ARUDO
MGVLDKRWRGVEWWAPEGALTEAPLRRGAVAVSQHSSAPEEIGACSIWCLCAAVEHNTYQGPRRGLRCSLRTCLSRSSTSRHR